MFLMRAQATVFKMEAKLRKHNLPLTDRELSVLTISMTEMELAGYMPFEVHYLVQVVCRLQWYGQGIF